MNTNNTECDILTDISLKPDSFRCSDANYPIELTEMKLRVDEDGVLSIKGMPNYPEWTDVEGIKKAENKLLLNMGEYQVIHMSIPEDQIKQIMSKATSYHSENEVNRSKMSKI